MAKKKRKTEGGVDLDMTPMIDVVFQLIIFFVVKKAHFYTLRRVFLWNQRCFVPVCAKS